MKSCTHPPDTRFCIAVEEGEAWLLGDIAAIKNAYPNVNDRMLGAYENDSICGTWEYLANCLNKEGLKELARQGRQAIGAEKFQWANNITPHMDVEKNSSPSFVYFRDKVRDLALNSHGGTEE